MINHPLGFGCLNSGSRQLYSVATSQRIKLNTIRLRNLDSVSHTCSIVLFKDGFTLTLNPGVSSVTISSGETLELISNNKEILLDKGSIISGSADSNNVIEYIIDGSEYYTVE